MTTEQAAAVERLREDLLDAHFNAASDIRTLLSLVASLTEEVEMLTLSLSLCRKYAAAASPKEETRD